MANYILRLYVATVNPSDELNALVSFIVSVYAPCGSKLRLLRHVRMLLATCLQCNPEITLPHRLPEESCRSCNPPQRFLCLAIQKTQVVMLTDERQAILELAMRPIFKTGRLDTKTEFARCPCHIQSVEKHIKLVTEASASVSGSESRDFIRARLESRSKMPKFGTEGKTSSVAI